MAVSLTVKSNVEVTTRVSISKKGEDLFIKGKLARRWCFKPGGSVEFWQNLLNGAFKEDARKKKFWISRTEYFNLVEIFHGAKYFESKL